MSIQCKVIDPGEGCTSVKLELLDMQLVRSLCKANFDLYVQCLDQLVPWLSLCRGCLLVIAETMPDGWPRDRPHY